MLRPTTTLGLLTAFALCASAQDERFPASTAIAEGVSPEALAKVGELVQSLVDDEEIVGAEVLVLKNGRTLLHEAFGWSDLDARTPLRTGSVFCVRSMTKPVIGTAILMLLEDDALELDDHVAQYLPSYDADGLRDITIEHLLSHTGGLPFSHIAASNLRELGDIQAVAARAAGHALGFAPGSDFQYSDHGTDTLTAVIEVVTGAPAADFVRARILAPLGMQHSTCTLDEEHPLRARALGKYVGTRGEWTRFWSPEDPPLFPFFLGSQGLYATLEDYARFCEFWLKKGRAGREKLLGARYVRKALTPGPYPLGASTGLPGLRVDYGYLMELWTGEVDGEREVVAFGHNGSDGTHAWVFPGEDAIVLYFTQSRNNMTGLRVEEVLGEVFLGVPFDPNQAAPPLEQYLGYYREDETDLYRAIVLDGDELALEVLGRAVAPLVYMGEDRWKLRDEPNAVLAFQRAESGPESGAVTGFRIGDHEEFRFEPSADLPSVDELAARVAEAHRLDLAESLGPLRIRSSLSIEKLDIEGEVTALFAWPDRFRIDTVAGEEFETATYDGEHARYRSRLQPTHELEGLRAETARVGHIFARFGDWRRWYPELQVVQRIVREDENALLVRTGGTSAPATTFYVDAETGIVGRVDTFAYIEGMGRVGQRITYGDFRDVSGMLLPYRTEIQIPSPIIGAIRTTVEEIELGVEVEDGTFELAD